MTAKKPPEQLSRQTFTPEQVRFMTDYAYKARVTRRLKFSDIIEELAKEPYNLTVSAASLNRWVKAAMEQSLLTTQELIIEQKQLQTATLEYITAEALAAWERSKAPSTQISTDGISGGNTTPATPQPAQASAASAFLSAALQSANGKTGVPSAQAAAASAIVTAIKTRVTDRDGNPAYLDTARAAMDDIRKIWGIGRPSPGGEIPNGELTIKIVRTKAPAPVSKYATPEEPADGSSDQS